MSFAFSLSDKPRDPAPHWTDPAIEALAGSLDHPFNDRAALSATAKLALQLSSRFSRYGHIAGEGQSSAWLVDVFAQLGNTSRSASGLQEVSTSILDIHGRQLRTQPSGDAYPASTDPEDRLLILTDYVDTGGSTQAAYVGLGSLRPVSTIDLATVGLSRMAQARWGRKYRWVDPASEFYGVIDTHGRVDKALTGETFRAAIDPDRYLHNTALVVAGLQTILNESVAIRAA